MSKVSKFLKEQWLEIKNEKYKWVYLLGFVYFAIGLHLIRHGFPGLGSAIVFLSIFGDGYLAKALNDRDKYEKAWHAAADSVNESSLQNTSN